MTGSTDNCSQGKPEPPTVQDESASIKETEDNHDEEQEGTSDYSDLE